MIKFSSSQYLTSSSSSPAAEDWIDFLTGHPVVDKQQSQDIQVWLVDRGRAGWIQDGSGTGGDRIQDGEHVLEIRTSGSRTGRSGIEDGEHFVKIRKARWDLVDAGRKQEEGERLIQVVQIGEEQQVVGGEA